MTSARCFSPFPFVIWLLLSLPAQAAQLLPNLKPPPMRMTVYPGPNGGNETFEQLIDHANTSLGTFSQRYWWNTTFWAGPGSPVLVFNPGEVPAQDYTGYLTNRTIMGLYAQEIKAAMILIEHRYWGESTPFKLLDTKNLSYLTLENSVDDMVHFARTVQLPFDPSGSSNAPKVPWITVGGSYSGALAAWTSKLSPGTFWAYHSSSAPVQAIYDYWAYFLPIQKGMPANCSADFTRIANHIDRVLDNKNKTEVKALKKSFGLAHLLHDDDFAGAVTTAVSIWQDVQFSSNYSQFFQMCDTIEGVRAVDIYNNGTNKPVHNTTDKWNNSVPTTATGIGLDKALPNYASWFKHEYLPDYCSKYGYQDWNSTNSVGCFDTYNTTSPAVTDWSYNNTINRQWWWMLCNQPFFYWQTGAPPDRTSLVSRRVTPEYFQRQCNLIFPTQDDVSFGSKTGKTAEMLNEQTGGWDNVNTTRLIWINGEFDPWRSASVSSELRPGGPLPSTPATPVHLIPSGIHCSDLTTRQGQVNKGVDDAQKAMVEQMARWVKEFYDTDPLYKLAKGKGGRGKYVGGGSTGVLSRVDGGG